MEKTPAPSNPKNKNQVAKNHNPTPELTPELDLREGRFNIYPYNSIYKTNDTTLT